MVRSLHPSLPMESSSWLVGSSLQHTTQSCEHQSKRPRASKMMSVKYFKCCEKERMRDTSVHRGEIDVKKSKKKKKHLVVECSPSASTLVWYSKWVSGPAGPGFSSGSWMVLFPFLVHCSWRLTRIWDSMMWCRLHRLLKVLQVRELLFAKMVHGILFWSRIFLELPISVPILEGIKQLWLWWSQRCLWIFQRWTSSNGVHTCKNFVLHPAVCVSRGQVLSFFPFLYFSLLSSPFLHSLHCDCSAKTRLKKMSFLFYCIILPFDLVMLIRMSYNVESAKSVLFSDVCNLS